MDHKNQTNSYTEFFYHFFRNILIVALPLITISALILSLPHSSAYSSSTDSVALTLPSACTISASVVAPHTITLVNGQKQDDISNTKINAYCNDNNGYFVYAIGSSNDIAGNTDLISSVNDNYNIHTGIYPTTLTTSTPSSWAMKLSSNNGTYSPTIIDGYDSYSLIPETDTIVAFRTSGTSMDINTDLTGSYFNTTYQIYTNSIQPAGTYLGKVKYTMTHPYDATQLPNIENAFDIAGVDKVNIPGVGSYYAMQDMTDRICSLVGVRGEASAAQLVDIRDNKLYWVAKLNDDNCWMTQNLELDLDSTAVVGSINALTSENTNLKTYGNNGYDSNNGYSCSNAQTTTNCTDTSEIITWVPARTTAASINNNNFPGTTAANSTSYSYNPGDKYYYPTSTSGNDAPYTLAECKSHGYTDCAHYKAGNYYNWSASVASNNTSSYTSDNTDASNSVCPKGWRLPKKTASEYQSLVDAYSITASNALDLRNGPLYFVRSGVVSDGSLFNASSYGGYWSDTINSSSNAYYLNFSSGILNPANRNYNRHVGFPVRCLAE